LNRGDTLIEQSDRPLSGDVIDRQISTTSLTNRPLDKEPHLAAPIARIGSACSRSTTHGKIEIVSAESCPRS
jgi:hypothetical protein